MNRSQLEGERAPVLNLNLIATNPVFCHPPIPIEEFCAPTSTFFGSQPRRAQVPPKGRESMTATSFPALRHRMAAVEAAEPVPITTTSYLVVTTLTEAF